jgi:branched-chain amino acid transport system substrate-binding protein
MLKNQNILIGIIIIIILALVGWRAYEGQKARGSSITIGAVLPLSGVAAQDGENEKNGIAMAISEINATGGIGGRQLSAIFEDDESDPKISVSAVTKLISIDNIQVMIGGTWDFLANAVVPVIAQDKRVMITPSTFPDTLQATSTYLFETHSPVAIDEPIFEKFLNRFKNPRVVVIAPSQPWGMAHVRAFEQAIAATHSQLVKEVILPNFDDNDIQGQLTLVKPLRPDVILTAINFDDYAAFMKRRFALGISAPVLAEQKVEDMYARDNLSADLLSNVFVFRFSPSSPTFVSAYQKMYGDAPKEYADTAYDSVYVIKQAIEESGEKTDADSIRMGLKKITSYQGASGLIDFSQNNYAENKTPILDEFVGGNFQVVQ